MWQVGLCTSLKYYWKWFLTLLVSSIFAPTTSINPNGSANDAVATSGDEARDRDSRLLDPKLNVLYDNFRRCYADILYRWRLFKSRVLVLLFPFQLLS